jgi:peptide deformylase
MAIKEILMLGCPDLYRSSEPVEQNELGIIKDIATDLRDTMIDFRNRYGTGRAIAAPQIGVFKRIIYMDTGSPIIFINPALYDLSPEMIEIWDDCMSFPDILVKVRRHRTCKINFLDIEWAPQTLSLEGDSSELLQHECDHLDGILAVQRAIDGKSFALRSQREKLR